MVVEIKEKVKLSELPAETLLSYEGAHFTLTAAELRKDPDQNDGTWYVCTEQRWHPTAKEMVNLYIENKYDNGMYEDWDERAFDCLKPEHYERIQSILDEAFKGDHATKYWMLDGPIVEIDC